LGAKVLIFGGVLQHVIRGGEHGGGDGKNRFLRAASGLQAQELPPVGKTVPLCAAVSEGTAGEGTANNRDYR
jgi:hypothetical protein